MRHHTVGEIMTEKVVSVPVAARFREVVRVMAESGVGAVPVLDTDGRAIGIVSEADLLHKEEFKDWRSDRRPRWERRSRRRARNRAEALTAREVMTAPVLTVSRYERIAEAARIMAERKVKRLPVVDPDGAVIGIVSRKDLLSIFLRPDAQIREEVEEEVVRRSLWEDPERVRVSVKDGSVLLTGTVAEARKIRLAVRLAQAVDGVVSVREELDLDRDDPTRDQGPS